MQTDDKVNTNLVNNNLNLLPGLLGKQQVRMVYKLGGGARGGEETNHFEESEQL